MEKTRKFMQVCLGIAAIICSLNLLVFSAKDHKAFAKTSKATDDNVEVAGTVVLGTGFKADYYVIGYNRTNGEVSVLGKINTKDMRD